MEWQDTGQGYYVATFVPDTEPKVLGNMTLTLDGTAIEGEGANGNYAFPNQQNMVAGIGYEDGTWMVMSLAQSDEHITISQDEFEGPTFYQGTVECNQQDANGYYGEFTAVDLNLSDTGLAGTINGNDVMAFVSLGSYWFSEDLHIAHYNNTTYKLYIPDNEPAIYSVDLQYYGSDK